MRGRVCRLQLLLVLASAVILKSESRGTHDHILPSQIQDSPNLEGQATVFVYPRNRVARLYPQALGSLFVASYGSRGYDGGIRPRLHTRSAFWVRARVKDTISSKYYIHIQSVPHRKGDTSPLQRPVGKCCLGKRSLFIARTIQNKQVHPVSIMENSYMLKIWYIYHCVCIRFKRRY
jgi:hypothetical protein